MPGASCDDRRAGVHEPQKGGLEISKGPRQCCWPTCLERVYAFCEPSLRRLSACSRPLRGEGGSHGAGAQRSTWPIKCVREGRSPLTGLQLRTGPRLPTGDFSPARGRTGHARPRAGSETKFIRTLRGLLGSWSVQGPCGPVPGRHVAQVGQRGDRRFGARTAAAVGTAGSSSRAGGCLG